MEYEEPDAERKYEIHATTDAHGNIETMQVKRKE